MKAKIALDSAEEQVRRLLLSFAAEYAKRTGTPLTLRITGGWVRDKLLDRKCHDIDVAIDKATGEEFATALQSWMSTEGQETASVHTIARNPDKSKHLETATTRVNGLDIDFVNLRSEVYTENSRIPTMTFGTPVQDALRRDATLNALFYNLAEDKVEDFTEHGLKDLQAGILRTPLDPLQTFRDDPLRVLRLVRFIAQLDFVLADDTATAMASSEIHQALCTKVSRERVGIELGKLIEGPYAGKALRVVTQLGLLPSIFTLPDGYSPVKVHWGNMEQSIDNLESVYPTLKGALAAPEKAPLWLAVLLAPWTGLSTVDAKNKQYAASLIAIKDGIKLSIAMGQLVTKMLDLADEIWALAGSLDSASRLQLGQLVRKCGAQWPLCLAFSGIKHDNAQPVNDLADRISQLDLAAAYTLKPLVNGKEISKLLDRKPGPWTSEILSKVIDAQLAEPGVSAAEIQGRIASGQIA